MIGLAKRHRSYQTVCRLWLRVAGSRSFSRARLLHTSWEPDQPYVHSLGSAREWGHERRMFKKIDSIKIINLPYRRDRRAEMERELALIGLAGDPRISFFEAIRPDDRGDFYSVGARGVYLSHMAILRQAAMEQSSVLILEDDCHFTFTPETLTEPCEADGSWDVFYGGYEAARPSDLMNSDLVGAHMMGFTHETARRLCEYLDTIVYDVEHPPIDAAYIWFRRAFPDIRTKFAVPPLAVQRSSRSDIADLQFYDRIPAIRPIMNGVRRLRSWCLQQ